MTRPALPVENPRPLSRGQSRREAGWLLFERYQNNLQRMAGEWVDHPDDETLHELRIALRRLRVLLRVFADDTETYGGRAVNRALARLGDHLGRARDVDVMIRLVQQSRAAQTPAGQIAAEKLIALMRRRQMTPLLAAQTYLTGPPWQTTLAMCERFRTRWAEQAGKRDNETIEKFLDHEFARHARKICKAGHLATATDPDQLHAFRIKLRRLRYLGDILGELAGKKMARAFARVHRSEQQLGKVHDVDIALAFIAAHPRQNVPGLLDEWTELRDARRQKFLAKWPACLKSL